MPPIMNYPFKSWVDDFPNHGRAYAKEMNEAGGDSLGFNKWQRLSLIGRKIKRHYEGGKTCEVQIATGEMCNLKMRGE